MSVEIPLKKKYRQGGKSNHKSTTANTGINRHRGEQDKKLLVLAQRQTRENQMVLYLREGRKITWVRQNTLT